MLKRDWEKEAPWCHVSIARRSHIRRILGRYSLPMHLGLEVLSFQLHRKSLIDLSCQVHRNHECRRR